LHKTQKSTVQSLFSPVFAQAHGWVVSTIKDARNFGARLSRRREANAGDPSGQGQQVDLQTGIRAERALAKKCLDFESRKSRFCLQFLGLHYHQLLVSHEQNHHMSDTRHDMHTHGLSA